MIGKIIGLLLGVFCVALQSAWKSNTEQERKIKLFFRFIGCFTTGWFLADILKLLI